MSGDLYTHTTIHADPKHGWEVSLVEPKDGSRPFVSLRANSRGTSLSIIFNTKEQIEDLLAAAIKGVNLFGEGGQPS